MKRLLILALLAATASEAAFKCRDERGITHVGDTPPAGCANVTMYEITRSGTVVNVIEPSLTPEQVKAKQEAIERQKEAAKAADEQRRKDLALLATYSTERDFDVSRDLNLKPIDLRVKSAQERIKAVEIRQKELEDEMEFYKAGKSKSKGAPKVREAPPQLTADLERVRLEKVALEKSVGNYEREMVEVRKRYDTDKKRWAELKQLRADGKLDLRSDREIEASKKNSPGQPAVKKYNLYLVPAS